MRPPAPSPTSAPIGSRRTSTFLADDLLEGREAGTRGHEIAARYIASQFALLGVKPGGDDGTYFETGGAAGSGAHRADAHAHVDHAGGPPILEHGKTTVDSRARSRAAAVKVSAPLVFVGYGMEDAVARVRRLRGPGRDAARSRSCCSARPKGWTAKSARTSERAGARRRRSRRGWACSRVQTRATASGSRGKRSSRSWPSRPTTWVDKDGTPFDPQPRFASRSDRSSPQRRGVAFRGCARTLEQILDEADKPGGRPKGFALTTPRSHRRCHQSAPVLQPRGHRHHRRLRSQAEGRIRRPDGPRRSHRHQARRGPETASTTARSTTAPASPR